MTPFKLDFPNVYSKSNFSCIDWIHRIVHPKPVNRQSHLAYFQNDIHDGRLGVYLSSFDGLIYKGFIDIYFMSVLICIFELGQVRALWCTPLYFNHPSTISTYQIGDSGIHKYQFIHLNRWHADAQPLWTVKN